MKRDYQPWSSTDIRHAATIWQRDFADLYDDGNGPVKPPHGHITVVKQKIADALQRSISIVQARFHDYGPSFDFKGHDVAPQKSRSPNSGEIERGRRLAALDRRDLTATFFGDPPPGYSALDDKMRGIST